MRFLSTLLASVLGTLLAFGILIFVFFLFIFTIALSSDSAPSVESGSVLTMDVSGSYPDVSADDPFLRLAMGTTPRDLNRFRTDLRKAASDNRIDALWLRMGGVSAAWATLEEMREALLQFRESGKPIYVTAPDYSMSEADYYLASLADSIFLNPEGLFEFNGFTITAEFYASLLEKLEVEPQVVRAGEFKSAVEPFTRTDLSAENREQLDALLTDWNAAFTRAVAEGRRLDPGQVQEIAASAQVFTAEDALAAGLVDDLLFHDEIMELLRVRLGYDDVDDIPVLSGSSYSLVPLESAGVQPGNEGEIAIVHATGAIVSGKSGVDPNPLFGGTAVGTETFREAMNEARDRDEVRAIVLRIDSPGGFSPAADEMWRAAKLAASEKPLVVSMGSYAASGGYWLATAGETIVADPLTLTGSIGVFSMFFDMSDLFENKLGVTFDNVTTTDHADMFSGLRSLTPSEQALIERSTQSTYQKFLARVAESRGMTIAQVDSVARGRIWTGQAAREVGLVDTLGSLRTAVAIAASRAGLEEGSYRLRVMPRPPGVLEMLTDLFGTSIQTAWTNITTPALDQATRRTAEQFKQLVDMQGNVMARMPFGIRVQ